MYLWEVRRSESFTLQITNMKRGIKIKADASHFEFAGRSIPTSTRSFRCNSDVEGEAWGKTKRLFVVSRRAPPSSP